MSILSPQEQLSIKADVEEMIGSTGETARVLRPVIEGQGSFSGPHELEEIEISPAIPCELKHLAPEEIRMQGHDLILFVFSDADIHERDIIELTDGQYRVTDVVDHNCFGVITHKEIALERDRRG